MTDLREQVAKQCEAVAHMTMVLAAIYANKAALVRAMPETLSPDETGRWSARHMEALGNILNGMDAVDPDLDGWMDPVFAEAHRLYPLPTSEEAGA